MPTSTRPRKPYHGPKSQRDLGAMRKPGPHDGVGHIGNEYPKAYLNDRKTIGAEPGSYERGAFKPQPKRLGGKRGILVATATTGTAAATVAHQRNKRRQTVDKIFNPFTGETVEFGKLNKPGRGKVGLAAGAAGAYAFDRASGGHNQRVGYRRYAGTSSGRKASTAFGAADDAQDAKRLNAASDTIHRGTQRATAQYASERHARRKESDSSFAKAKSGAPEFGTAVRSVAPRTPSGKHVSHENKLYQHGKRKKQPKGDTRLRVYRGKGTSAMPEIKKSRFDVSKDFSTQQGAARMASRGTPLSTMANVGRHGRRIVGFEEQVVH